MTAQIVSSTASVTPLSSEESRRAIGAVDLEHPVALRAVGQADVVQSPDMAAAGDAVGRCHASLEPPLPVPRVRRHQPTPRS
jgi:hypothetical protein